VTSTRPPERSERAHEANVTGTPPNVDPDRLTHRQAQPKMRAFRAATFPLVLNGRQKWGRAQPNATSLIR